ncbi:MAG TPA: hypothetical protein VGP96_03375 [Candidatus Dormibacteraeota bacterium]|nr:hypothetical protein [Candidatus Dormibacteraeota bacterium]
MRAASRAARIRGDLRRRTRRLGPGLLLATILAMMLLTVALVAGWNGDSAAPTRITLTMPCSRVDAGTVGHSAYGLDQVLSASCLPVPPRR